MADQKLNEISQVQSAELASVKTFLAVMNNGEIKQMSKEDMASVVGGLLGVLSQIQNASTSSQMRYVKIATLGLTDVSEQEGISNTVTLLVVGGNAYSTVRQVSFVSITSHRGVVYANKNTILGSVEIGYSVNDQILDVWVHATNYNHYINSVLLGTTYASLKSDIQVEMPNNYQVIE